MLNPVRLGLRPVVAAPSSTTATSGTLGVVHLPKTGGMAIRIALAGNGLCYLGPRYVGHGMLSGLDSSTLPDSTRGLVAHGEDLRDICCEHRLVMGHYTPKALLEAGCVKLAVQLREPRARLLSLYRYWQSLPPSVIADWGTRGDTVLRAATLSFEDFLQSPAVWADADNAMARQVLGVEGSVSPRRARRRMQRSLRGDNWRMVRDRLGIVEWSQESQRFADRICEEAGMAPTVVARENETRVSGDVQILDRRCVGILDERTRVDRELTAEMMNEGLAPWRSDEDLDAEWRESVAHLRFVID